MTEIREQDEDDLLSLVINIASVDGKIRLVADGPRYDFHITAEPDYDVGEMRALLGIIGRLSLEMMDEDECEPEILDDDAVRLYLTPIVTTTNTPLEDATC